MNTSLDDVCPQFSEAEMYWHLDELYKELDRLKGKSLSCREKQWLRGLLLGYSPREINRLMLGCINSNALRPGLSQKLYPLIKQLISEQTQRETQLGVCCIPILMEKLGYRKALMASVNTKC